MTSTPNRPVATPRLSIRSLQKAFAVPVLRNVDLDFWPGEIHALVGENGAGKSTLMNILGGLVRVDSGELRFEDTLYQPKSVRDAHRVGISFAVQELSVVESLSVGENVLLSNLPSTCGIIDQGEIRRNADIYLRRVGLEVDLDSPLATLSLPERQLVEVAKTLSVEGRLVILDEPTAALTEEQAERLHKIIRELAKTGTTVVYISHRLEDVLEVSDKVSVLRDGAVVTTRPANELSVADLIYHMTGREADDDISSRTTQLGAVKIRADGVSTKHFEAPINLSCCEGEIVGIAGLSGSGRSEFLHTIFGLEELTGGKVTICREGADVAVTRASKAVKLGIGLVAEDRKTQGIFLGHSVAFNMTLAKLSEVASRYGIVRKAMESHVVENLVDDLAIKCRDRRQRIDHLSGGNQQKALIGRWLQGKTEVLLLDEPTRGIDVKAKFAIYDLLHRLRDQGRTVIVASSEIEELMKLCDRILVLSNREFVGEFDQTNWSAHKILDAAFENHKTMSH